MILLLVGKLIELKFILYIFLIYFLKIMDYNENIATISLVYLIKVGGSFSIGPTFLYN